MEVYLFYLCYRSECATISSTNTYLEIHALCRLFYTLRLHMYSTLLIHVHALLHIIILLNYLNFSFVQNL